MKFGTRLKQNYKKSVHNMTSRAIEKADIVQQTLLTTVASDWLTVFLPMYGWFSCENLFCEAEKCKDFLGGGIRYTACVVGWKSQNKRYKYLLFPFVLLHFSSFFHGKY